MPSPQTSIRIDEEFARWDDELEDITGEKTRTGRIKQAMLHLYQHHENIKRLEREGKLDELGELAEALSTNVYPLEFEPATVDRPEFE